MFMLLLSILAMLGGCDSGAGYQRGLTGAWSYGGTAFTPADPATFQPLSPDFARDARQGYYRDGAVAGSDGATFEALSEHEARDQHAVYYCDTYRKAQEYWAYQHLRTTAIAGADAATYRPLGHGYARDLHRAYDQGQPFAVRDVASFEPLSPRFARDAQRGYFEHTEIPGSHGPSFVLMNEDDPSYARDRAHAWHGHIEVNQPNRGPHPVVRPLRGADLATLRALGHGYAADARQVWYEGEPLAQADAGSFTVLDAVAPDMDARDNRQAWQRGRTVPGVAQEPSASR
ncbi:hypothetical protein GCM10027082_34740 [Comamonas humi]